MMGYACSAEKKHYAAHSVDSQCIHPDLREGYIQLPEALGFKNSTEGVNSKAVKTTQKIRMLVEEEQRIILPRTNSYHL